MIGHNNNLRNSGNEGILSIMNAYDKNKKIEDITNHPFEFFLLKFFHEKNSGFQDRLQTDS